MVPHTAKIDVSSSTTENFKRYGEDRALGGRANEGAKITGTRLNSPTSIADLGALLN